MLEPHARELNNRMLGANAILAVSRAKNGSRRGCIGVPLFKYLGGYVEGVARADGERSSTAARIRMRRLISGIPCSCRSACRRSSEGLRAITKLSTLSKRCLRSALLSTVGSAEKAVLRPSLKTNVGRCVDSCWRRSKTRDTKPARKSKKEREKKEKISRRDWRRPSFMTAGKYTCQ